MTAESNSIAKQCFCCAFGCSDFVSATVSGADGSEIADGVGDGIIQGSDGHEVEAAGLLLKNPSVRVIAGS